MRAASSAGARRLAARAVPLIEVHIITEDPAMADDPLNDALVRVRTLLIDLERHVDRGAAGRDLAEVGRAWVRAAQVERLLRSVLPADVAAQVPDVGDPGPTVTVHHEDMRADGSAPPGS